MAHFTGEQDCTGAGAKDGVPGGEVGFAGVVGEVAVDGLVGPVVGAEEGALEGELVAAPLVPLVPPLDPLEPLL